MSLSAIKAESRLALHQAMGEPCSYTDGVEPSVPTLDQQAAGLVLLARFHTKQKTNPSDADGIIVMEPIEKVVFQQSNLDALGVEPEQGAEVHWPGYGVTVVLDMPLDPDGPENVYWTCTRA